MRPIIAGVVAGVSVAIINRFFSGVSSQLLVGLITGAASGIAVMYIMRPKSDRKDDDT